MNHSKSLVLFDKDLLFHPYSHALTLTACSHVTSFSSYCSSVITLSNDKNFASGFVSGFVSAYVSGFVSSFVCGFVSDRAFLTLPYL